VNATRGRRLTEGDNTRSETVQILVVEDNPGAARLIREALQESPVPSRVSVVHNGDQSLAFLRQEGAYADAARPDLILLDLHLPRTPGLAVLAMLRADPHLHRIPVVVLTGSQEEADRIEADDLGARLFLLKPSSLEEYRALVWELVKFWGTRPAFQSPGRS
jgi:chemotaxis family two-component system response regulator Rcp1